ncbi:unnamed protein product [Lactuca saligna]|uniref:Uncharacterized protein n=1 Tax=Lactuca saligna TaxID=75948 RepID=A0AA35YNN1_LACSI|nr:unnamed protein product [Lactuca saligna]
MCRVIKRWKKIELISQPAAKPNPRSKLKAVALSIKTQSLSTSLLVEKGEMGGDSRIQSMNMLKDSRYPMIIATYSSGLAQHYKDMLWNMKLKTDDLLVRNAQVGEMQKKVEKH